MSDSVRPHRQQPTRLPCPWDSPGKNTGVGCHFLLQCMKVKSEREVAQSCLTLGDSMDCSPPGSSVHGIFQARVPEWGAIAFSVSKAYFYLKCICGKLSIDFIIFLLLCIADTPFVCVCVCVLFVEICWSYPHFLNSSENKLSGIFIIYEIFPSFYYFWQFFYRRACYLFLYAGN